MEIKPSPEQEATIQLAIRAGLIACAKEALDVGLPALRERLVRNMGGAALTGAHPSAQSAAQERLEALLLEGLDGQETTLSASAVGAIRLEAVRQVTMSESVLQPKKSAYGLLAKYGPDPSEEEIDDNRRKSARDAWARRRRRGAPGAKIQPGSSPDGG